MHMETKNVIVALSALAQESRLAIFRLLVQTGPQGMAATKIAEQLGIPPSSLSFHFKELVRLRNALACPQRLSFFGRIDGVRGARVCGPGHRPAAIQRAD